MMRFGEMPETPNFKIPNDDKNRIMQATMKFGDEFIRLSDWGSEMKLNAPESKRIALVIEAAVEEVKHAFEVLKEEGKVGMELTETFYSACAGIVFDKFGVMWNLTGQ